MNKVAIMTLNGNPNFGNKLQNYAMQNILAKYGFEGETIINTTNIPRSNKSTQQVFKEGDINLKLKLIKTKLEVEFYKKRQVERRKSFDIFNKKYIKEMPYSINVNNIPNKINDEYRYFIAGSDQVWNPNVPAVSQISFLSFAPIEKRLTYAPSFGVSQIEDRYKKDYEKWLSGINNISVREYSGAKIIKELTNKEATVLVDPTMLLTKNEWLDIATVSKHKPKKNYLLTYFLGKESDETKAKIKEIAKQKNLEIVPLGNQKFKKYYEANPSEFIDYINDAKVFITDSFHGCVFATILETPFIVCDRVGHSKKENMSSRIDTFTKTFKLEDRKFENIKDETIFNSDYKESMKKLELEKIKSNKYLEEILVK